MHTPQIIYLVIMAIGLLGSAHEHGKPRTGKHNFWSSLIGIALVLSLLVWGGFFK